MYDLFIPFPFEFPDKLKDRDLKQTVANEEHHIHNHSTWLNTENSLQFLTNKMAFEELSVLKSSWYVISIRPRPFFKSPRRMCRHSGKAQSARRRTPRTERSRRENPGKPWGKPEKFLFASSSSLLSRPHVLHQRPSRIKLFYFETR